MMLGASASPSVGMVDTTPIPPLVHDMNGNAVLNSTVGQTMIISKNFTNGNDVKIDFVLLIEVRDENGVTQFLAWQTGSASPKSTKTMGVSWTPNSAGEYHIRTFPISNLINPQVLGSVETTQHSVLSEQRTKAYKLQIDDNEYAIEHSLDGGYIRQILYDEDLASTTILLDLSKDSQLSKEFPYELAEQIACSEFHAPGSDDASIEVFVDTIPASKLVYTQDVIL
jgi:hypothetical protein